VEPWFWCGKEGSTIGYGWIFQNQLSSSECIRMKYMEWIYTKRPQMQLIIGWNAINYWMTCN
jgi:hypothetical protein